MKKLVENYVKEQKKKDFYKFHDENAERKIPGYEKFMDAPHHIVRGKRK